jgi:hypothetical protein
VRLSRRAKRMPGHPYHGQEKAEVKHNRETTREPIVQNSAISAQPGDEGLRGLIEADLVVSVCRPGRTGERMDECLSPLHAETHAKPDQQSINKIVPKDGSRHR